MMLSLDLPLLFALVASLVGLCLVALYRQYLLLKPTLGNSKIVEKPPRSESDRAPGEWIPVSFEYPRFEPWLDFDFEKTPPPPYRPFRWGPYHITMGLRSMKWPEWIELDNRYVKYHAIRTARTASRGDRAVRTMPPRPGVPGGAEPALEVVYELSEYLSRRYPQVFRVTRLPYRDGDYGWYKEGQIHTIEIIPVGVKYDLSTEDPMKTAGLLVQDDLMVVVEGADSRYYFQAASVCTPGFWRMEDKIGKPLDDIHMGGKVPQYESKLKMSLGRFFIRLRTDKPVLRNNYFMQIDSELAWSETTNGNEDVFDEVTHAPKPEHRADFKPPEPTTDARTIHFRTERQSLRRLPRTGAILFTVRTYIEPVVRLAEEPGVPGRMSSAIRSWPEDVAAYKGQHLYKDAVLSFLDDAHSRQVADGLAGDERTSDYPF